MVAVGSEAWVDQDDWQLYDGYGRMMAVVYCGGKNLNEELLEGRVCGYIDAVL